MAPVAVSPQMLPCASSATWIAMPRIAPGGVNTSSVPVPGSMRPSRSLPGCPGARRLTLNQTAPSRAVMMPWLVAARPSARGYEKSVTRPVAVSTLPTVRVAASGSL